MNAPIKRGDTLFGAANGMTIVANHHMDAARQAAHHLVTAGRRRHGIEFARKDQRGDGGPGWLPMLGRDLATWPDRTSGRLLLQSIVAAESADRTAGGAGRDVRRVFAARHGQKEPRGQSIAAKQRAAGERSLRQAAVVAREQALDQFWRLRRGFRRIEKVAKGFRKQSAGDLDAGCRSIAGAGQRDHRWRSLEAIEEGLEVRIEGWERARAIGVLAAPCHEGFPRHVARRRVRFRRRHRGRHDALHRYGAKARGVPPHVDLRHARAVRRPIEVDLSVAQRLAYLVEIVDGDLGGIEPQIGAASPGASGRPESPPRSSCPGRTRPCRRAWPIRDRSAPPTCPCPADRPTRGPGFAARLQTRG